jgi:hypothetical protein
MSHPARERERHQDREETRKLINEAEKAATEGARVVERLRIATEQYRERLGHPPERGPKH